MILKDELLENDELNFILKAYEDDIKKYIGNSVGIAFFASSEEFLDTYKSIPDRLNYQNDFDVTIFNDYSIGEEKLITDFGVGTIKDPEDDKIYTIIKIVSPFTRSRTYDFVIGNREDMPKILSILDNKRKHESFEFNEFPIIGLDFTDIQKQSIDFLMNDEFRKYCKSKHIKLKRGIVLEGRPGTGKTLTIQWIKNMALKNNIEFHSFKNVDDFIKNQDEYYDDDKKIFVFEDFDTLLRERKDTDYGPNQVLGMILNTLEGVNEINNVVSIFTTNEIKVFDSAFIRPGRIDKVYSYGLPNSEVYREFLEAYIPEEKQFHDHIDDFLKMSSTDISFAILKGICDDINIYKFHDSVLTKEVVDVIIKEKLTAANKKVEVKDNKDYIL